MISNQYRPGNTLISASRGYSYLENRKWFCTECRCLVAAHIEGKCRMKKWKMRPSASNVRDAPLEKDECGCTVVHYIFKPLVEHHDGVWA